MPKIQHVHAREVLDSRGNPTVEVEIDTENFFASAIVPSGASTGAHEACELRDGDKKRYMGKGVLKAVENVNTIINDALKGFDASNQKGLDTKLIEVDGTPNKSHLGANAILGTSLAAARIGSFATNKPLFEYFSHISGTAEMILPRPMMNVINGGQHADNNLDIQEFMIIPNAETFHERLRMGAEIFHNLKKILQEKHASTAVGDEGGFAPNLATHEEAFGVLMEAISQAGYMDKVDLAIDAAASEFYKDGKYMIEGQEVKSDELIDYYGKMIEKYPLVSVEDPFAEDDWNAWVKFTEKYGDKVQIVGDDLLVTNVSRLKTAIKKKACNAILIKLNQIGTVTETIEAIMTASDAGWNSVVSHRSGETEDTTIADFSVGLATGQIKTGSLSRTDRVCKYNQLLRIEEWIS
jgi:enolase